MASLLQYSNQDARYRLPRHIDWWLVLASGILLLMGLLSVYSVDYASHTTYFRKQLINTIIGVGPFLIFFLVQPRSWQKARWILYGLNLGVLALVLVKGTKVNNARRWLDIGFIQFQPSELAKILTVITLAAFLASRADEIKKPSTFVLSLLHVLVPVVLIFEQPHLGSSLVMMAIWASVCLAGGVPLRYVFGAVLAGTVLLGAAFSIPGVMNDYQRDRIAGLVKPDSQGNAWQPERAMIAIGHGGVFGSGYLKGEQKQGFVPEQQNDFIFTIVGEEGGLVGASLMLAGFGFFFFRVWLVMFRATDPYSRMLAAGVFGMLVFHMTANIGMNLKILPVVGLWLPFISFGGTAMWLCLASVGLILNVQARDREAMF